MAPEALCCRPCLLLFLLLLLFFLLQFLCLHFLKFNPWVLILQLFVANLCFNFLLISLYSSRYFAQLLEYVFHFLRIYLPTPVSVIQLEGPPVTPLSLWPPGHTLWLTSAYLWLSPSWTWRRRPAVLSAPRSRSCLDQTPGSWWWQSLSHIDCWEGLPWTGCQSQLQHYIWNNVVCTQMS